MDDFFVLLLYQQAAGSDMFLSVVEEASFLGELDEEQRSDGAWQNVSLLISEGRPQLLTSDNGDYAFNDDYNVCQSLVSNYFGGQQQHIQIHRQPEANLPSPTEIRESTYAKIGPNPEQIKDAM